jgi:hypothetical protein
MTDAMPTTKTLPGFNRQRFFVNRFHHISRFELLTHSISAVRTTEIGPSRHVEQNRVQLTLPSTDFFGFPLTLALSLLN